MFCIDETYEKKDGAGSEGESLEALRWDGGELLKVFTQLFYVRRI